MPSTGSSSSVCCLPCLLASLPLSPLSCHAGNDVATEESQVGQHKETALNESLERLREGINEAKVGGVF